MAKNIILILAIINCINLTGQNAGDILFDDSFLHEIKFENADTNTYISTKDYQQLDMIVDGVLVDSIGLKRKGNISGYPSTNKFPIKIKTNKYVKGKDYDGIKEFTLHMNYQDPTMLREKLTYDICSDMGLFSLRTAFAKVYTNGIYWGLYTLVEGKDELFKHVFDNKDMDAVESLDMGNMCYISNNPNDYDYENNGGMPYYQLENGEPSSAWVKFSEMIDKVNNTADDQYMEIAPNYLNLEHFFKYQAINVYLMNFDSYIGFYGNQIYAFDQDEDVWQVIPWDFNASFGLWNTNNFEPTTYPLFPGFSNNGCVFSKLNTIPQLKDYYLDAMCNLLSSIGDTLTYFDRIDELKMQIQQAVYEDNRKVVSNSDFDNGIDYGYFELFGENQPALKTFLAERRNLISNSLEDEGYECNLGINKDKFDQIYKIYPNPAKEFLNIEVPPGETCQTSVYDANGQNIFSEQTTSNVIDISAWKPGLYIITIISEKSMTTRKLVKE